MTSFWVVRRADVEGWDPTHVVHGAPELGPREAPGVRLGDIAEPIAAQPLPPAIRNWVVPPNVDVVTGTVHIRRRADKSGAGYALGVNLLAGDVLVPRRSLRPCVLIDGQFEGVAFSEGFTAIRCRPSVHPSLLWALLSSRSGRNVRKHLLTGGTIPHLSWRALREVTLHLPTAEAQAALVETIPRPTVEYDDRRRSRWIIRRAEAGDWQRALFEAGIGFAPSRHLQEFVEVVRGRVRAKEKHDLPLPGLVPVCVPEMIRSEDWRPSYWAAPVEPMTDGDSVAVPAVRRFHAAIPPAGMTVGYGTFLLRPRGGVDESDSAQLLRTWLNGDQGQAILAAAAASHLIPGVSLSALRKLPIPTDWSAHPPERAEPERDAIPLADRLEGACR